MQVQNFNNINFLNLSHSVSGHSKRKTAIGHEIVKNNYHKQTQLRTNSPILLKSEDPNLPIKFQKF